MCVCSSTTLLDYKCVRVRERRYSQWHHLSNTIYTNIAQWLTSSLSRWCRCLLSFLLYCCRLRASGWLFSLNFGRLWCLSTWAAWVGGLSRCPAICCLIVSRCCWARLAWPRSLPLSMLTRLWTLPPSTAVRREWLTWLWTLSSSTQKRLKVPALARVLGRVRTLVGCFTEALQLVAARDLPTQAFVRCSNTME